MSEHAAQDARSADPAPDRDRHRLLFYAAAIVGIVLAAALGIREVLDRPVVRVGAERVSREGLESTVQVLVTNHSDDTTYCVEVRVGALDPDGLDLQDVPARSGSGDERLGPGETENFTAVLDGLTEAEYEEELDEFVAYVDEREAC